MVGIPAESVPLTGADQVIMDKPCTYRGYTIRETAGATAVVRLFDNASAASGTPLEEISLGSYGSTGDLYESGLRAVNGITVDVVSGTVVGSVRYS